MRIDEMPAGREMDALLAEHVLKWRKMHGPKADYDGPCESYDVLIPPGVSDPFPFYPSRGSIKPWFFCRKWSTDIADAWEVAEKITDQKHWAFKLRRLPGKDYMACFIRLTKTGRDDFESKPSKTAPLAICRAALKAMGVTEI